MVILLNRLKYDHSLSIVSPSLRPIPEHRLGPNNTYETYTNKFTYPIEGGNLNKLEQTNVSKQTKSKQTRANKLEQTN